MEMRKLEPGEKWSGVHKIVALAEDGTELARYACPCQLCELWHAAAPMMEEAMNGLLPDGYSVGIDTTPLRESGRTADGKMT